MATFSRSPKEVSERVRRIVRECYPELNELMEKKGRGRLVIDCLDVRADLDANGEPVGPAIKHGGYAVSADIRVTPKAQRALGLGAVLLRIDADGWDKRSEEEKDALIDHELFHLILKKESASEGSEIPKLDDLGFPLFGMRLHDVEVGWFVEVAKRRGFASVEVQQAKRISEKWGQYLFDFATTENLPGLRKKADAAPEAENADVERWVLWEQLNEEQREEAEALSGNARSLQIGLDATGTVVSCKAIPDAETDAMEQPISGRKAASKGQSGGGAKKPAGKKRK